MIKDEVREIMEEVEIIVIEDEEKEIKRKNK